LATVIGARSQASRDRRSLWDKFWKDRHGRVVIYQHPNLWLIGFAVLAIISILSPSNKTASIFWDIGLVVLAIWSLLEIAKGVNYFRRAFGLFVLLLVVSGVFGVGL
jgi:hypothetical protein